MTLMARTFTKVFPEMILNLCEKVQSIGELGNKEEFLVNLNVLTELISGLLGFKTPPGEEELESDICITV